LKLNLALGLLVGLLVGTVWAVANGAVTSRVTDAAQLRSRLGLPVLSGGTDAPLPKEVREGTAVMVGVGDIEVGDEARTLLQGYGGLSEVAIRVEHASGVREGDRVVLVLRAGQKTLGVAEDLLPGLRAAGAVPVAAVLVPGRRGK
jgi:hypothetical protein